MFWAILLACSPLIVVFFLFYKFYIVPNHGGFVNWLLDNLGGVIATVIIIIIVIVAVVSAIGDSGSSKKSWGDLTKTEQDNARWAYYAQEAAKKYSANYFIPFE